MRLIIPYTQKHRYTVAAAPVDAEWLYVGDDTHHYWRTMCDVWARSVETGEDVAVLEHDCLWTAAIGEHFQSCARPWCVNPYDTICHWECMERWANMLGCTRFRADMIRAVPDAVTAITRPEHLDWHNLCDGIAGHLRDSGYTHHWHLPPVHHHRGVQSPEFEDDQTVHVDWDEIARRFA